MTTLQCGCFAASLAAGVVAEKLGRKYSLVIAAILAIFGTIMQAAAVGHLAPLFIGRFVAGLGVGEFETSICCFEICRLIVSQEVLQ